MIFILGIITLVITALHQPIRFDPQSISVERDSTGFVQAMVRLYSTTGDTIRITDVQGSCGCATASVQRPIASDTTPAKIYIGVNAKHFTDSLNNVDFTVSHTGPHSPAMYRVVVAIPKNLK